MCDNMYTPDGHLLNESFWVDCNRETCPYSQANPANK
jgi:hypothetical protein